MNSLSSTSISTWDSQTRTFLIFKITSAMECNIKMRKLRDEIQSNWTTLKTQSCSIQFELFSKEIFESSPDQILSLRSEYDRICDLIRKTERKLLEANKYLSVFDYIIRWFVIHAKTKGITINLSPFWSTFPTSGPVRICDYSLRVSQPAQPKDSVRSTPELLELVELFDEYTIRFQQLNSDSSSVPTSGTKRMADSSPKVSTPVVPMVPPSGATSSQPQNQGKRRKLLPPVPRFGDKPAAVPEDPPVDPPVCVPNMHTQEKR